MLFRCSTLWAPLKKAHGWDIAPWKRSPLLTPGKSARQGIVIVDRQCLWGLLKWIIVACCLQKLRSHDHIFWFLSVCLRTRLEIGGVLCGFRRERSLLTKRKIAKYYAHQIYLMIYLILYQHICWYNSKYINKLMLEKNKLWKHPSHASQCSSERFESYLYKLHYQTTMSNCGMLYFVVWCKRSVDRVLLF